MHRDLDQDSPRHLDLTLGADGEQGRIEALLVDDRLAHLGGVEIGELRPVQLGRLLDHPHLGHP